MMSEKGFSTVEMAVGMLVVAATMVFSLPDPSNQNYPTFRLDSAAREIVGELHLTRVKAISRNKRFRVNFNAASETYQVEQEVASVWQSAGPTRNLASGLSIVSASDPVFSTTGITTNQSSIVLQNEQGYTKTLDVSVAGRAEIQ